jgi:hypothetical protein
VSLGDENPVEGIGLHTEELIGLRNPHTGERAGTRTGRARLIAACTSALSLRRK